MPISFMAGLRDSVAEVRRGPYPGITPSAMHTGVSQVCAGIPAILARGKKGGAKAVSSIYSHAQHIVDDDESLSWSACFMAAEFA